MLVAFWKLADNDLRPPAARCIFDGQSSLPFWQAWNYRVGDQSELEDRATSLIVSPTANSLSVMICPPMASKHATKPRWVAQAQEFVFMTLMTVLFLHTLGSQNLSLNRN